MINKKNLNFFEPYVDKLKRSGITGVPSTAKVEQKQGPLLDEKDREEIAKRFDGLMDDVIKTFEDTISKAKNSYYLNVAISIIVVIFGVLLLSLSMYFGFSSKGFSPFSSITAAVGVADFVALFFVNPQTKIRRAIGDLAQMQMIYTNWCLEAYSAYENLVLNNFQIGAIQKFQETLKQVTTDSVKEIEDNIGNDQQSQSNGTSQNDSGTSTSKK